MFVDSLSGKDAYVVLFVTKMKFVSIFFSGIVDSSGLRLYFTPTLRQYDAGVLTVGASVNRYQVVPPHEPNFISSGFCTQDCIQRVYIILI